MADATYIPTAEGTVYLAAIQDVFSRRVVGWSMSARQDAELIDRQPRHRFRTRAEPNREVLSYLEGFYNPRRIHSVLDYRSPVAYERRYAQEHHSTANPKMNCPSN